MNTIGNGTVGEGWGSADLVCMFSS